MCTPNLKSVAVAILETWTKLQNLKVGQGDRDYDPLTYFCTAYFLLRTVYLRAKFEAYIASAIREILTGIHKFKVTLGHV